MTREIKRKFFINIQRDVFADLMGIQIQEYTKETDKYWMIEREGRTPSRIFKDPQRLSYYDTWYQAHEALYDLALVQEQRAVSRAKWAKRITKDVQKMKKPHYRFEP